MRRTIFILLIVVVIGIVGFYAFLEFRTNRIVFNAHNMETRLYGKEFIYRRLYNSNVDAKAFQDRIDPRLIEAEFTEEEFFTWAIFSGDPELYLVFYHSVHPDFSSGYSVIQDAFGAYVVVKDEGTGSGGLYILSAQIAQEAALEQTSFNFKITDLYLEVISEGPQIVLLDDVFQRTDRATERFPGAPVLSEDGRLMAVNLGDVLNYSFHLAGEGRVTLKYTYNIVSSNIFARKVLEEQLLIIDIIILGSDEFLFSVEPFTSMEEYIIN
jgi:hypothetical protein